MYERKVEFVRIERERRGSACETCGTNDDLQWHHRDPDTFVFAIAHAGIQPWRLIADELVKCDLLCGPCHRAEHVRLRTAA